jgi:dihydroflavonol-4-reductase
MKPVHLVTGAAGHLGNSLVRALTNKGNKVRASVRNLVFQEPFADIDCEVIQADLLDKKTLMPALTGIEVLYQVAAVFTHWSKDPQKEIIDANLQLTRNILEAAAEQGVKKIVYISSIAALDRAKPPLNETMWNKNFQNPYFHAKTVSEQLAWELADKLNISMVAILPSAMIGPNAYGRLTPTMRTIMNILQNKYPYDPGFNFNFVHIMDVADGIISAARKGRSGERYILATEPAVSLRTVMEIAQGLFSDIKIPATLEYEALSKLASLAEAESRRTGQPPALQQANIDLYYQADIRFDISKAKNELGFAPMPPLEAIKQTLLYLRNWQQ